MLCHGQTYSSRSLIAAAGMLNRREMQYRVEKTQEQGIAITNYGILIAHVLGILPRALEPFPAARLALGGNWRV